MSKNKFSNHQLGQDPAFPIINESQLPNKDIFYPGISKRLYIAVEVMKKIDLPKWSIKVDEYKHNKELWARECFSLADELLKQENE